MATKITKCHQPKSVHQSIGTKKSLPNYSTLDLCGSRGFICVPANWHRHGKSAICIHLCRPKANPWISIAMFLHWRVASIYSCNILWFLHAKYHIKIIRVQTSLDPALLSRSRVQWPPGPWLSPTSAQLSRRYGINMVPMFVPSGQVRKRMLTTTEKNTLSLYIYIYTCVCVCVSVWEQCVF